MLVDIENRELRTGHLLCLHMQHRLWLKIPQQKSFLLLCIGVSLVTDLRKRGSTEKEEQSETAVLQGTSWVILVEAFLSRNKTFIIVSANDRSCKGQCRT